MGLGSVFDHRDAMLAAYLQDRVHVGHLAVEVDGHDGFRARCDGGLDLCRVYIARIRFYVGECRNRPVMEMPRAVKVAV